MVVTSSGRSGTSVTWSGFTRHAMPTISVVAAISMLSFVAIDLPQQFDVAVLDVPAITAQMNGDALGASQFGDQRGSHRLRLPRLAAPAGAWRCGRCSRRVS